MQPLHALYERILDAAYSSANPREGPHIDMVLTAVVYAYNPFSMPAIGTNAHITDCGCPVLLTFFNTHSIILTLC